MPELQFSKLISELLFSKLISELQFSKLMPELLFSKLMPELLFSKLMPELLFSKLMPELLDKFDIFILEVEELFVPKVHFYASKEIEAYTSTLGLLTDRILFLNPI